MTTEVRDEDLHAYIDGELDDLGRSRIQSTIDADPVLRHQHSQYRADKARLVSLYGGGLNEPLPREWIQMIESPGARRQWNARTTWAIAAMAATVVLVLAGSIAYRNFAPVTRDDVVADALAARAQSLPPDSVVPIRSASDAQTEAAVMTRELATRVKAPDLTKLGYRLVGIDIYDTPVRSFDLRYRDDNGRIVTLYLRRSSGATRFDQFPEKSLRVCIWQDDVIGMVMAGPISAAEMQRLASLAYTGLT
jgi:anti-sigma factor RsiW